MVKVLLVKLNLTTLPFFVLDNKVEGGVCFLVILRLGEMINSPYKDLLPWQVV